MSKSDYEICIPIQATQQRAWDAIINQTNEWWLPGFHVAGADSIVTLDVQPGGLGLIEQTPCGSWLSWYKVHMYLPSDYKIYLIGQIAPEWGGPATSSLKLAVETGEAVDERDDAEHCVLKVTDARIGHYNAEQIESYQSGWRQLFTDGLKKYMETGAC